MVLVVGREEKKDDRLGHVVLLELEPAQNLPTLLLELLDGERGPPKTLREQAEPGGEIPAHEPGPEAQGIPPGEAGKVGGDVFHRLRYLPGRPVLRALGEHLACDHGKSALAFRLRAKAA